MKTERVVLLQKNIAIFALILASSLALTACGPEGNSPPTDTVSSTPPAPERDMRRTRPRNIIVAADEEEFIEIDNRPARLKINVGVMLPLSGETAQVGQALLNAATMALFDAKDQRLELIPVDTEGTPEGAVRAVNYLIENNVDIIIGPLFSESIKVAQPIAKQVGVKMIGFSNDHDVAGDALRRPDHECT